MARASVVRLQRELDAEQEKSSSRINLLLFSYNQSLAAYCSRRCIQPLAAYLVPSSTSKTSCIIRPSLADGSEFSTLGHNSARPRFGSTVIFNCGNRVPPPCSTSLKYRKKVKIHGPHQCFLIFKQIINSTKDNFFVPS